MDVTALTKPCGYGRAGGTAGWAAPARTRRTLAVAAPQASPLGRPSSLDVYGGAPTRAPLLSLASGRDQRHPVRSWRRREKRPWGHTPAPTAGRPRTPTPAAPTAVEASSRRSPSSAG